MSCIDLFLKTFFFDQVASIDIQYLEVILDQFFLGQDQATSVEPSYSTSSSLKKKSTSFCS
jgi:hypothetical protein